MPSRPRFKFSAGLLRFYFILGILVLGGVWFFYSQFLLIRLSRLWRNYSETLFVGLENDTQLRSRIYAKFMSRATEPAPTGSAELDIIFEEIIKKIDFPVIITNADGSPSSFRNLPLTDTSADRLSVLVAELDGQYEPIPLVVLDGDSTRDLGMIHYGLSSSTVRLREINARLTDSVRSLSVFSVLQVLLLVGFVTVGVWGILEYKRRQQEHIWTALAKETAHQLATPLSSLSAWLDLLKSDGGRGAVSELDQDLTRMRQVLDRFSRIGLPPERTPSSVGELITRSVEFVRRRAPRSIVFTVDTAFDPVVEVDDVLFSWMLENLLKNGVDAIGARAGEVAVSTRPADGGRLLEIEIVDTGEGVKLDKVFDPGVTSKKYGWGVGLALARRIVENYHSGKLVLKRSRPGRTEFSIFLPTARDDARGGV